MPMRMFYDRLPEIAMRETRSIYLPNHDVIPPGQYVFIELYCDEDGCDCRRVHVNVLSENLGEFVAVINYGWETVDFYAKWFRGAPAGCGGDDRCASGPDE